MFQPMSSSSGIKIIGRGKCCLLLLFMLLLHKFSRFAYVFELVGCILSCYVMCCLRLGSDLKEAKMRD
jgi:hypothetical protein